jgi:hypothetical protein
MHYSSLRLPLSTQVAKHMQPKRREKSSGLYPSTP